MVTEEKLTEYIIQAIENSIDDGDCIFGEDDEEECEAIDALNLFIKEMKE